MKSGRMKRILLSVIAFLFVGCSIAGGTVLLSNTYISDSNRGGDSTSSENELTKNAPTNSDLWTNGHYATAFDNEGEAGVDGSTEEKAYEIRTAEQFARLAYLINDTSTNSTYRDLYYVQTADIDLSAHYWDAIGTSSYYFRGHYDGGEHTISGLYTEAGSSSTYSYQGLFGCVRGQSSIIENVGIIDSNIQGYQYVGGVVGETYYSTVTNCYNTGSVSGLHDVGGIIGRASNAIITNCHNIGDISERTSRAVTEPDMLHGFAGIVGFAGFSTMIVNCYNTGTVSGSSNPVGGVVGQVYDGVIITNCYNTGAVGGHYGVSGVVGMVTSDSNSSIVTITNCYNTGNVTGGGDVGGVVGYASDSTITNCYNTGTVDGSSYVGGVVGDSVSTIINCYNTGKVTGDDYVGGVVGYANSFTITNCYNTGAVDGGTYIGGVVGRVYSSTITNNYYGGNCTLSYGIGSSSSNTGASKDSNLIANAKSLSWYQDSSKWASEYPWDFENAWTIVNGMNDGYPILQAFVPAPDNDGLWTDAGNYADSFAGGDGQSEATAYQIATPEQLARLAYLINSSSTNSTYKSLYYVQTANLDMSEYWWDAIGYSFSYCFSGHYDGGGYTISGLYTEAGSDSAYSYQGLFGYVEGKSSSTKATIKNVGIIDSNIQGYRYVGGVAGRADYSTITNCYNTGDVTGSSNYVGGVVGYASSSTVTNCYNTGDVTRSSNYVGGVVGDASYSTITNCYNTGAVDGYLSVGGVVGDVGSSTVTNCYNTGAVDGNFSMGGVVGRVYSSTITNNYYGGNCTLSYGIGDSSSNTGASKDENLITNAKSLSWYQDSSKWSSEYPWDFEWIWEFVESENDGYPVLRMLPITTITLNPNGGTGGAEEIYFFGNSFYTDISLSEPITQLTDLPSWLGHKFEGYFTSPTGGVKVVDADGNIVADSASISSVTTLYAQWVANNPAKYDSEGGYWYVENGKLPQSKVDESLKSTLEGRWSSLTDGSVYYMGVEELVADDLTTDGGMQSKMYGGEEYVKFNGEYYLVEPIRWRLVYSSSQKEGYAVENTSVLATMAEIVFVGSYSSTKIGAGEGYSAESVTMLLKNQVSAEFLVSESREVEIFGAPKDTTTESGSVFVASSEELANFTTNKNNTTGSGVKPGKVSLSDFVKDYLRATGQGNYYFTRDLGDQLNTIRCLNPVGDRSQAKAQQTLGVQFTIKVTEYACESV